MYSSWPCPMPSGATAEEMLLGFDRKRDKRLLVLLPLFDEAGKMRRQVVETMRLLDALGVDAFCPDLPGCNESLAPHGEQSIAEWRIMAEGAARHVSATHVLAIRSGSLVAPTDLPGWAYEPVKPRAVLLRLARAEQVAAHETGASVTAEGLIAHGLEDGVTLAGWTLGPKLVRELDSGSLPVGEMHQDITQQHVGGGPLWLRTEPAFDADQAKALAAVVAEGLGVL